MKISPDLTKVMPDLIRTGTKEMISVRTLDGITYVRINFSSVDLIQTCPRKAQYVLSRNLKAKSEPAATLYGSAIHKALEVFYSHSRRDRTMPKDFLEHAELIPAGVVPPEEHFLYDAIQKFCEVAAPLRALPESDKRSLSTGIWTLYHYFKTYLDDPYVVYCDEHGPVTERQFTLPVITDGPVRVDLFGTIDVVLQNEHNGIILPTDHKTSSIVGVDFYNRLKPNHQYTGYLLGAQQVLGLDTDSFMVNCIQVKQKPLTARGQPPHFPRQVTKRSPEDIAEFKDVLLHTVTTFLACHKSGIWPLGPVNSCTMYGGCNFLDVCGAPNSLRETMLAAKYKAVE